MAIARYGVEPTEILNIISTTLGQQPLGSVWEGQRRFPVVAKLPEAFMETPQSLEELKIKTPSGGYVPLGQLVHFNLTEGLSQVNRANGQRRAVVSLNFAGEDLVGFVRQAQAATAEVLPPGMVTEWGGEFQNYQRAQGRLMIMVPAVMGAILFLLWLNLNRFSWAMGIFLNVPFAAVGGIMALFLRGYPFSISAGVGFLTLFGVAVLNGLVLLAAVGEGERKGGREWREIVREAAESRLRPVMMTALVASLGFLPMALAVGAGAEVQKPLATVVIGGLITSTLLTLFVLPAVLCLLGPSKIAEPDELLLEEQS